MRPDGSVASHHFEALGTSCSLFAGGHSRMRLLEGELWVRRLGARLTRFSTDSELSRLNRSAGQWTAISDEMEVILRAALHAHEMSAGLVNAAVLPSMLAAGYTRPFAEGPTVATLEGVRPPSPLPEVLEVRPGEARVQAGCGIDLGGIAKGWMADRLCEMLGPNFVANLGGDLRAVGPGPAGDGWPVGVAGVTLMLRDQAAATSSVRRRSWGAGPVLPIYAEVGPGRKVKACIASTIRMPRDGVVRGTRLVRTKRGEVSAQPRIVRTIRG